jgi:sulfate/thiosulfate transport system substrate-binding protein
MPHRFNAPPSRQTFAVSAAALASLIFALAAVAILVPVRPVFAAQTALLNVSYDPTRELFADVNARFVEYWQARTGERLKIRMSHGGSGKQARAVIDGLQADVVTLALAADIDAIASKSKMLPLHWQSRLPHNSTPYSSTIVFLVRAGNPKNIRDWGDLARDDVAVITPNPKTSGGARWNYLAAWTWASREYREPRKVLNYMARLYGNVPVLDAGARGAATSFAERGMGDVLIAWENEAMLTIEAMQGRAEFQIVMPSISIKAEPPVAWVDRNIDRNGTRAQVQAYLHFLYTPQAQRIAAKHHFRPALPQSLPAAQRARFKAIPMVTIDDAFGGWLRAQAAHFADGGFFDRIYRPRDEPKAGAR